MKKSKVIIPAMALLLFSTAASITGTVAWFTSSRVFTMDAGQFEVAQLDGNLDVTVAAGVGTTLTGDKTVNLDSKTRLVDTSVNNDKTAYRLDYEGNNDYASLGTPDASSWLVKTTDQGTANERNYYAAVSWTMTISYTFAAEKDDMGVYLDLKTSAFTAVQATDGAGGSSGDSAKGFRIMFHDGTNATVWGNHTAELNAAPDAWVAGTTYTVGTKVEHNDAVYSCKTENSDDTWDAAKWTPTFESTLGVASSAINLEHVSGVSGESATTDYQVTNLESNPKVKGDYVVTNNGYTRISDGTANADYRAERIATIAKAASGSANSVTVTCIAWFEGTDPNVVNGTAMKSLSAAITIYARCDA